jgi:DNA-directed RNA polymerase subunit A'
MKIKKTFDEDIKILKGISFGLLSPDMIRKMSRVEVKIPDTYDEDGYPIENGLMDTRMGVIDPGLTCRTCSAKTGDCPGHFGHIELTRPVLHIGYIRDIYLLLKVTCKKCGRLLLSKDEIEKYKKILEDSNDDIGSDVQADLIDRLKKIKRCPHCGEEQQEIKLVKPYFFYELYDRQRKRLYPTEIRERLEKIPDEDLKLLGFNPYVARPEWAVLTCLPVPPVTARPSIILESGERSEDDLTHKLVDILRVNQRFADNIAGGAPMPIIEDLWDVLQYHVATFFTNEISGVPAAKHRSGRALKKSLRNWLIEFTAASCQEMR